MGNALDRTNNGFCRNAYHVQYARCTHKACADGDTEPQLERFNLEPATTKQPQRNVALNKMHTRTFLHPCKPVYQPATTTTTEITERDLTNLQLLRCKLIYSHPTIRGNSAMQQSWLTDIQLGVA